MIVIKVSDKYTKIIFNWDFMYTSALAQGYYINTVQPSDFLPISPCDVGHVEILICFFGDSQIFESLKN